MRGHCGTFAQQACSVHSAPGRTRDWQKRVQLPKQELQRRWVRRLGGQHVLLPLPHKPCGCLQGLLGALLGAYAERLQQLLVHLADQGSVDSLLDSRVITELADVQWLA